MPLGNRFKRYFARRKASRWLKNAQRSNDEAKGSPFDHQAYREIVREYDSAELIIRATEQRIDLSMVRTPEGVIWEKGIEGTRFLHSSAYQTLRKLVEESEKDARKKMTEWGDLWIKLATMISAAIAAGLAIWNLIHPSKH